MDRRRPILGEAELISRTRAEFYYIRVIKADWL
jgi:hypothetical protein